MCTWQLAVITHTTHNSQAWLYYLCAVLCLFAADRDALLFILHNHKCFVYLNMLVCAWLKILQSVFFSLIKSEEALMTCMLIVFFFSDIVRKIKL